VRAASTGDASRASHLQQTVEQTKQQKNKFSPQRSRDTAGARLASGSSQMGRIGGSGGAPMDSISRGPVDRRVPVYDQADTCSLSSVMQTNVPQPYSTSGNVDRSGTLSMPHGQWAQNAKYVSGDLQENHHRRVSKTNSGTSKASKIANDHSE